MPTFTGCFFPSLEGITPAKQYGAPQPNRKAPAACMRMALRILQEARAAFGKAQYQRFDGNPGDSQCQVRAICLYLLVKERNEALQSEMHQLCTTCGIPPNDDVSGKEMEGVAFSVNNMVCSEQTSHLEKNYREMSLPISFELQFLLQAYLSECMRNVVSVDPSGTVLTAGVGKRLDRIDMALDKFPLIQNVVLTYNQMQLSKNSALLLQNFMIQKGVPETLELRDVNLIQGKPVPLRTFSQLTQTINALIYLVSQAHGILVLREIVPKEKEPIDPKRCQLKNSRPPQEFYVQMPEGICIDRPTLTQPVIIVEAVFNTRIENIVANIVQQAQMCPQFEKGSHSIIPKQDTPFTLDHFFVEAL